MSSKDDETEGPVALISGGSRGLGLALVKRFLDEGWRVATFSRSATHAVAELQAQHGDAEDSPFFWCQADGASEDDLTGVSE